MRVFRVRIYYYDLKLQKRITIQKVNEVSLFQFLLSEFQMDAGKPNSFCKIQLQ